MLHQVQTAGDVVAEYVVAVQGGALGLVGAEGLADVEEVVALGGLADQVEAATGGAGAGVGRARTLAHFHLLDVEHLAGLRGDVAQAVDEGVALGVEAANDRPVAGRVATLAGPEGDARGGAQRIGEGQRAGVLDHLLGDDGDRLGGLAQRRGVLLRRGLGLVALLLLGVDHADRIQRQRLAVLGVGPVRCGKRRHGADCRSQYTRRRGRPFDGTRHHIPLQMVGWFCCGGAL
ncbi:hypothetical protein D3C78_1239650 [compost metagenome]